MYKNYKINLTWAVTADEINLVLLNPKHLMLV